jgi:acetyltransferase
MARLKGSLPAAANMKNPVDVIGDARADRYTSALAHVLEDPNVDQVLVILTPQSMTNIDAIAQGICHIHETADKPIACAFMGAADVATGIDILQQAHIPHYILPEWACRAMADVQRIINWRRQSLEEPQRLDVDRATAEMILEGATPGYLCEDQALDILSAYGLPVPHKKLCTSAEEAAAFADQIGYPVVLKIVSPQIIHKWDVKGVVLNLPDAAAVRKAFDATLRDVGKAMPEAEIRGVIVRQMVPDGHEVILGAKRDPSFGPTLMFGLGGLYVELFKDVTFALAPISRGRAARMIRQVKALRLLEGLRGAHKADIDGIQECIIRIGQLVSDFDRISELDVNPLIVGPAEIGSTVADVRIHLDGRSTAD